MIDLAHAADASSPAGGLISFAPLILILVVFYFLIMRPQQKKLKAQQQMITELKKGDKVLTVSGIFGKITKVSDQSFSIEVAPSVEIEIERGAVSRKLDA